MPGELKYFYEKDERAVKRKVIATKGAKQKPKKVNEIDVDKITEVIESTFLGTKWIQSSFYFFQWIKILKDDEEEEENEEENDEEASKEKKKEKGSGDEDENPQEEFEDEEDIEEVSLVWGYFFFWIFLKPSLRLVLFYPSQDFLCLRNTSYDKIFRTCIDGLLSRSFLNDDHRWHPTAIHGPRMVHGSIASRAMHGLHSKFKNGK